MAKKRVNRDVVRTADEYQAQGIAAYQEWDVERAEECFEAALSLIPEDTRYLLGMARVLARSGDFDRALQTLAEFVRLEPESAAAARFEHLFGTGMDEVEQVLTRTMTQAGIPLPEIGSAIQMWLEYRITLGSDALIIRKPETWAAALDYTVRKVNLRHIRRQEIADLYGGQR